MQNIKVKYILYLVYIQNTQSLQKESNLKFCIEIYQKTFSKEPKAYVHVICQSNICKCPYLV